VNHFHYGLFALHGNTNNGGGHQLKRSKMHRIAVIGSGFAGLSAASYLGRYGHEVHIYEKNAAIGGRARQSLTDNGFVFDMGPSWYWMPDVFEKFFNDFDLAASDFYELKLLDPSFDIVFAQNDTMHVPASFEQLCQLFESIETGSAQQLIRFMEEAAYKYNTSMDGLIYKPGLSLLEFVDPKTIMGAMRLQIFSSFSKHVKKFFTHPKLIALMEFPVLFLGAMPKDIPALYSLMNYAGLKLGTWYPMGGFGKVIDAMAKVASFNGAVFHTNATVASINSKTGRAVSLTVNGKDEYFDAIVAATDYHHAEQLLPKALRNYDEAYWSRKTFAPSTLIFYLGINKKIKHIEHHTLFFDEDIDEHSKEIYSYPQWPTKPLFYVCCPSRTDDGVAPAGCENLFLLMPIAIGLEDSDATREKYFSMMMARLQEQLGEDIESHIIFKKSYCVKDFVHDYNAYKGNAYGLANTLSQTAILKPSIRNSKVGNLFYAGQLTVPGPGVPPSIISGKIAATQVSKHLKRILHEAVV
jgi:phytoene desaturase